VKPLWQKPANPGSDSVNWCLVKG